MPCIRIPQQLKEILPRLDIQPYFLVTLLSTVLVFSLPAQTLMEVEGGIKVGDVSEANPAPGTIRFKDNGFQGWNGFTWLKLGGFKIYGEVVDIDGNHYHTVKLGNQVWMAENLRALHYNDGTDMQIQNGQYIINFGAPGTAHYPNNQASTLPIYGTLYDFYCIETNKLCPTGWSVPSNAQWEELINFLGGTEVAGTPAKETGTEHWAAGNTGNNESGYTLRGAGRWHETQGESIDFKSNAFLWSRTSITFPYFTHASVVTSQLAQAQASSKLRGCSVRCVKNVPF
ncbi:MAG: hypothetical protein HKN76_06940 [Saprospiraceae bacterium]|nr:hypothetical protein [Saprospiraceae bacterium]